MGNIFGGRRRRARPRKAKAPRKVNPKVQQAIPGYGGGLDRILRLSDDMIKYAARTPQEVRTAEIDRLQKMANREALINALKSAEMEQMLSPEVSQMRKLYNKQMLEDFEGGPSKELSNMWLRQGLEDVVATGANLDSGFARSALADRTREDYWRNRMAMQDRAAGVLAQNQAPVAGLDVGSLAQLEQQTKAENIGARDAYKQQVLGLLGGQIGNVSNAFQQWAQMEAQRRANNAQAANTAAAINAQNAAAIAAANRQASATQAAASSSNNASLWGAGIGAIGAIGGGVIAAF